MQAVAVIALGLVVPVVVWAFDLSARQEMHDQRLLQVERVADHVGEMDRDLGIIAVELEHIKEDQRESKEMLQELRDEQRRRER